MIKTHVAGLARLRLPGFDDGEGVPRMAGIARSHTETHARPLQFSDLGLRFQADLMAAATALHPFRQRHGEPVRGGHSFHRRPSRRVLATLELFDLRQVAGCASLRSRNLRLRHVRCRRVLIPVAHRAVNGVLAVFARLPVGNNVRRDFLVAVNALLR